MGCQPVGSDVYSSEYLIRLFICPNLAIGRIHNTLISYMSALHQFEFLHDTNPKETVVDSLIFSKEYLITDAVI